MRTSPAPSKEGWGRSLRLGWAAVRPVEEAAEAAWPEEGRVGGLWPQGGS